MLRSFLSLILLTGLNVTPPKKVTAVPPPIPSFQEETLLKVHPIPTKKKGVLAPVIKAKAVLVMDVGSGTILFEKNQHTPLPIASLTKIMTAVLILDNHDLSEIVTIDEDYAGVSGVKIGLQLKERLTVKDLLMGLLIRSGGDAALALAKYHSGSVEAFVKEMNKKATTLHLNKTQFKNPIGLDEAGNYSTPYDLAMLSKYAMRNPYFRSIVRLPSAEITSLDGQIHHSLQNTNQLLGSYLHILGVKTGTTEAAGDSVINMAQNEQGIQILAILLNSPQRFQENKSLIDWSFRNFLW